MKWISIKNKLPEYNEDVLCYDKDNNIIIMAMLLKGGRITKDRWFRNGFGNYGNQKGITYWMPLPKPPAKYYTVAV